MSSFNRLAFIGNSLPRRCGIATFTTDLQQAVAASRTSLETSIVAMSDHGHDYNFPPAVQLQIHDERLEDYIDGADFLNTGHFDAVCLQHEFGIFGGEAGSHIMALLSRLTMPTITTLHTIPAEPTPAQRSVLIRIIDASSKVVVMAEKGRELLRTVYGVAVEKIEVIPHGIPDFAFVEPDEAKTMLGFKDKSVILTFGLLSPNKGIETMIDAMPSIMKSRPDAVYVVLGATHPNLVREQGEAYRESLVDKVRSLGIDEYVIFLDQFVDKSTLLSFIAMCDVYVSPYLNEEQITSGTLAYSFGLGKAVVSTPYWHAQELLGDGRGILIPFRDTRAIGSAIGGLLNDNGRRLAMRQRAYATSRSMTWERTGERYLAVFEEAVNANDVKGARKQRVEMDHRLFARDIAASPPMELGHFLSMCDDTGLFQHATHCVPDRNHGYCTDDNARALLLACALNTPGEQRLAEVLTARFSAFVQHAWNPTTKRFRNFMSFDRRWLEDIGSEDSHARTLWALGRLAICDVNPSRRHWATSLFDEALGAVEEFTSPRAWAFTLLGLDDYCVVARHDMRALNLRELLANRLISLLYAVETADWVWFEEGLSYDNARLSQALIVTGSAIRKPLYAEAGLRSLRWLTQLQTSPTGFFRPVGTKGFGEKRRPPHAFDQQPVEATAMISACLSAWRSTSEVVWQADATRIFAWFLGSNDLCVPLADTRDGSCCDGLHADRANQNKGGESVLSYLSSLAEIRQLARENSDAMRQRPIQALDA
ncbi:glycosyltransferase family 4 protein [Mesorhizobium sp. WSM3224]|uniref:glycosyltransferase family 4 protein n=1 Tax=Mesorhizobium sp. WSM3224 TaxID=1040986 RepID=UPI00041F43B2|nr:glycosyltransferase family 4 protein [Mesorhizobium sp. WSM3224]